MCIFAAIIFNMLGLRSSEIEDKLNDIMGERTIQFEAENHTQDRIS